MVYQEKKINESVGGVTYKWQYWCEDLFGEATIKSKKKLVADVLDEIVIDVIMARHLVRGFTPRKEISFSAIFKAPWEDDDDKKTKKNK